MRFSTTVLTSMALALGSLSLAGCGASTYAGLGLDQGLSAAASTLYTHDGQADILVKTTGALSTSVQLAGLGAQRLGLDGALASMGWQKLEVPTGNVQGALTALKGDPAVIAAEPDLEVQATVPAASRPPAYFGQALSYGGFPSPNVMQYAPIITRATMAWATSSGQGQTIAIVDTGVDTSHPDFAGRIVPGWNILTKTTNDLDDYGHGTHCAGIAAAYNAGSGGVMGIAPSAKIMPVKALDANGSGSDSSVAQGVMWAADHGATVISLSLGGPGDSFMMEDAVAYALKKGVSVVAAMGNNGTNAKSYPAAIPGVISVGATDEYDQAASFSQWGNWISVCAPGVSIYSTLPTYHVTLNNEGYAEDYGTLDGTSMATPAVAGAVADIRAAAPALGPNQVKARLEATADKVSGQANFDPHYGYGRIDVLKAVKG